MKKMKKFVSFLLTFAMVFAMNFTNVFAAQSNNSTIEYLGTSYVFSDGDEGIMPLIWSQFTADLPANSTLTLSDFSIPDRYMAFEATATVMGGGTNEGTYSVHVLQDDCSIAGIGYQIDGIMHKKDWIDFQATDNKCGFKISNNASVAITVKIVYYSWR